MGLFSKKEPKKRTYKDHVMLKDGLPNFLNDIVINIIIDEPNECITFAEAKRKDIKTASLKFDKIVSVELGEKASTVKGNSTGTALAGGIVGGTTGAVIGSTMGNNAGVIPTLKIRYQADTIKEINLYQCNYYSENSIQLVKMLIDKNIARYQNFEQHVDL